MATYQDVNSNIGIDFNSPVLSDINCIQNGLTNMFSTVPGQRGRIFQPTYGSAWAYLLQEQISTTNATKIIKTMINDIKTWQPWITVIEGQCTILVDYTLPGYSVTLAWQLASSTSTNFTSFALQTNG